MVLLVIWVLVEGGDGVVNSAHVKTIPGSTVVKPVDWR